MIYQLFSILSVYPEFEFKFSSLNNFFSLNLTERSRHLQITAALIFLAQILNSLE